MSFIFNVHAFSKYIALNFITLNFIVLNLIVATIFLSTSLSANATTPALSLDLSERSKQSRQPDQVKTLHTFSNIDFLHDRSRLDNSHALSVLSVGVQPSRLQKVLLLRVSFNNQAFTYSRTDFQDLMFSSAEGVSSVANYYLANSYGDYLLQPAVETEGVLNDGIVDVYLDYEHPNFGDRYGVASDNLVKDAINTASASVDFKSFDLNDNGHLEETELAIVFIVAGYENAYGEEDASTPNVWAHQKEISFSVGGVTLSSYAMFGEKHQTHLATIGIISHELGHVLFGLPDLYDRQKMSNGIGTWGLMGLGSWNSHSGVGSGHAGSAPAHMMAWTKIKAGFVKPQDVEGQDVEGQELVFNLASSTTTSEVLRLWVDPFRHGEHFLLELRTDTGYDRGLPGHGLLISHVDDWVGYGKRGRQNDLAAHKLVDIEEADGNTDLDGLLNRGDEYDVFNDAYGQDYFGGSSVPSSADYRGNLTGIEASNIKLDQSAAVVTGLLVPAHETLGNNLGYDDGGIGTTWGIDVLNPVSLVEMDLTPREGVSYSAWLHGVDIYSHGEGSVKVSLYSAFESGVVSAPLLENVEQSVGAGWNRITFEQALSAGGLNKVYLQVQTTAKAAKIFSLDNEGVVSGHSYIKTMTAGESQDSAVFEKVDFDFNQRLLVASQQQTFDYFAPNNDDLQQAGSDASLASDTIVRTSAGSFGFFIFALLGLALVSRAAILRSNKKT